jgi:transketolase
MGDLQAKAASFGWHAQTIQGNNMDDVVRGLKTARGITDRPTAIIAETKKGYGILPVLEQAGDTNFHGKPLSKDLAEKALALLGG